MLALIRKEITTFFASAVGYLVIAIFLILNSLFLWVFKSEFNIFDTGFASIAPFFQVAPWILLFLIPAVTMRSISEERKLGTLELLLVKPFSHLQLVLGKYFGAFLLIFIALIPSLLYVLTIIQLGDPIGNFDLGSTLGSYIGLLLLCALYTAIGIFASAITPNQIVAFLVATFLCFFFYFGFSGIANYQFLGELDYIIEQWGMQLHYERINRGIIDSRDVFYFLGLTAFFIVLTTTFLTKKTTKFRFQYIGIALVAVFLINIIGNNFYKRFDLTQDQRFTVSEATENIILDVNTPIIIDVLLKGSFPAEFKRLQAETRQLLEEFNALNPNVKYVFTDPFEGEEDHAATLNQLQQYGLTPLEVSVQENGKKETEVVIPWAIANFQNRSVKIPLLKNTIGATTNDRVTNSIQQLEYAFADGFSKLIYPKKKKIAMLKGNGQLPDIKIADFVKTLQDYYFVGAFTLDSVASNPKKTLQDLKQYDLIINAKPTQAFSDKEKYVLDQHLMHGGKALHLVESVAMELDSLFSPTGSTLAFYRDLNLKDAFFSYGARINPVIINDLYSAPLVLASGQGNNTQFTPYPWYYASLAKNNTITAAPIVKNIEAVKFEFSNQIDTLKNDIKKTILLSSSDKTKLDGVPKQFSINDIRKKPNLESYNKGAQPLAVLLEGKFKSAYKNRVKPIKLDEEKDLSIETKLVLISDGDIIKNNISKGQPLALGYDPYTFTTYGNKEFLLNTVNYLLDDTGLISVRSKEVIIPFLSVEKIVANRAKWQLINLILPLVILGLFGFVFFAFRKRKYVK
ncbi:gliding motility-associated ABC transporter substrate-binding protein GldG [Aquimarina rhabdastrellae]